MKIRTVTGDVPAEKTGRTLTHEHLLYTYPGGEYDHLSAFKLDDAVDRVSRELAQGMQACGYATIVDMTPCEVGRHPELMKRVAERTGCNVIAVTGFFPESMGVPYWFKRQTVDELADFYVRDITAGHGVRGHADRHQGRRDQDRHRAGRRHAQAQPARAERLARHRRRGAADPCGGPRAEAPGGLHQHPHRPAWTTS